MTDKNIRKDTLLIDRELLAAPQPQPAAVPEGYVLVPVEPTSEMLLAAEEAYMPFGDMDIALRMAVLAAAPPAEGVSDGYFVLASDYDYDALKNKLDYALKILENSVEMLKEGDFSTGYCCCGDSMSHPCWSYGHSPVDEGDYHAGLMIRQIEEFIENNR